MFWTACGKRPNPCGICYFLGGFGWFIPEASAWNTLVCTWLWLACKVELPEKLLKIEMELIYFLDCLSCYIFARKWSGTFSTWDELRLKLPDWLLSTFEVRKRPGWGLAAFCAWLNKPGFCLSGETFNPRPPKEFVPGLNIDCWGLELWAGELTKRPTECVFPCDWREFDGSVPKSPLLLIVSFTNLYKQIKRKRAIIS